MKKYFRNIKDAIVTTAIGLKVTFRHLFTKSVTVQYPSERWELPERSRMRLYMDWDDCIGCLKCARACPVDCIYITTKKVPKGFEELGKTSNGTPKRLFVEQFDIDMSECMYCSLCVDPCPEDCIYMTREYEFSVYEREELVYDFVTASEGLKESVYEAMEEEEQARREALKRKEAAKAKEQSESSRDEGI